MGSCGSESDRNQSDKRAVRGMHLGRPSPDVVIQPEHLALLTAKYWGAKGVRLTVGFLDNPPADLKARILSHMNAWGEWSNVQFSESCESIRRFGLREQPAMATGHIWAPTFSRYPPARRR